MSGFKYVRVLNIPGFPIGNSQGYIGFIYFCKYERVLRMHQDAIMEGL